MADKTPTRRAKGLKRRTNARRERYLSVPRRVRENTLVVLDDLIADADRVTDQLDAARDRSREQAEQANRMPWALIDAVTGRQRHERQEQDDDSTATTHAATD